MSRRRVGRCVLDHIALDDEPFSLGCIFVCVSRRWPWCRRQREGHGFCPRFAVLSVCFGFPRKKITNRPPEFSKFPMPPTARHKNKNPAMHGVVGGLLCTLYAQSNSFAPAQPEFSIGNGESWFPSCAHYQFLVTELSPRYTSRPSGTGAQSVASNQ